MKTIKFNNSCEINVKKSKFISNIFQVNSREEAEERIKEINKKYHDARHNCYAYIIDDYEKCSDDGEPSKTAGTPMLDIIKKRELTNVLVIVTRYFGGILLGTGGLVKAYSEVTQNVIDLSEIVNIVKGMRYEIEIAYDNYKDVCYYCRSLNINITDTLYENNIILLLESTEDSKNKLLESINLIGTCKIKENAIYFLV